jgi:hypothetical protein
MKNVLSIFLLLSVSACSGQNKVSNKIFDPITLINSISFNNSKYDQPKFSCGFLLKYKHDTVAVTAKHLLKVIKPEEMTSLTFDDMIKSWTLYPLNSEDQKVSVSKLLNENKSESLDDKDSYKNDWLAFSIAENRSNVKVLEARMKPLQVGQKLYVVGWTRKMDEGAQRVYEFEYYKTIGNRILLKDVIVPEQFGGLSGAPVLDESGAVVGLVSNSTNDPATDKKYFSPCAIEGLITFLDTKK